jgi:hypothetical protein
MEFSTNAYWGAVRPSTVNAKAGGYHSICVSINGFRLSGDDYFIFGLLSRNNLSSDRVGGKMKKLTGEEIGGYATAIALIVSIITFVLAYFAQERFYKEQNKFSDQQLEKMEVGLSLQKDTARAAHQAADAQHEAAEAQREAAAVEALGRYISGPGTDAVAWESAEAIIDLVNDTVADKDAWKATAKRALYHHPGTLRNIECELYSDKFKDFVISLLTKSTRDLFCAGKGQFEPLASRSKTGQ